MKHSGWLHGRFEGGETETICLGLFSPRGWVASSTCPLPRLVLQIFTFVLCGLMACSLVPATLPLWIKKQGGALSLHPGSYLHQAQVGAQGRDGGFRMRGRCQVPGPHLVHRLLPRLSSCPTADLGQSWCTAPTSQNTGRGTNGAQRPLGKGSDTLGSCK